MSGDYLETTVDKFVLRVKRGLIYSKDHVWVDLEDQRTTLGLTDYAQRKDGDIVFFEFPLVEERVGEGQPIALFETIKAALEILAPFDCSAVEVNRSLEDQPELVNQDPYGAGWVARVEPTNPEDVGALLSPEQYFEMMKREREIEA